MFKNYFILNRLIIEFNNELNGFSITDIFSQEKDKLVFRCAHSSEEKYIEICVNPGFPYIALKSKFNRAKKNTIDFFTEGLPLKILYFEIADADRTIRLKLETGLIYFTIRGKYTNVAHQIKNHLEHFKNPPEDFNQDNFIAEQDSVKFLKEYNIPEFRISGDDDVWNELKSKYPYLGKEILSEVKLRIKEENKEQIISTITQIIKEIFYEKPAVFLDQKNLQVYLGTISFGIFTFTKKIAFEDIISAYNFLLSKKFNYEQLEEEYQRLGNLLLINISSVRKGMKSIELEDIYNENTKVNIKLNENLSPKKNVDNYFDKAKNDRIRIEKSQQLFKKTLKTFNDLKKIEQIFLSAEDPDNYHIIMKELNMKEASSKDHQDDIQSKFKHYLIEDKYNVFVGKNNTNNDLLTLKFAKQNDYWFHARSVPGSHVVLRVENTKEIIPKNILKKAASLAAFHSKAKTAGTVPVSYTFKKYVIKKKGMEPGKVALLREDTLLVKPEIPSKCEYIEKT
ncbi:MAG: NFACT RNA binding domain-containing protein [Ignavibacteriaceae bacterium]